MRGGSERPSGGHGEATRVCDAVQDGHTPPREQEFGQGNHAGHRGGSASRRLPSLAAAQPAAKTVWCAVGPSLVLDGPLQAATGKLPHNGLVCSSTTSKAGAARAGLLRAVQGVGSEGRTPGACACWPSHNTATGLGRTSRASQPTASPSIAKRHCPPAEHRQQPAGSRARGWASGAGCAPVVSNSSTVPSHTTRPWCRKMMRSTAGGSRVGWRAGAWVRQQGEGEGRGVGSLEQGEPQQKGVKWRSGRWGAAARPTCTANGRVLVRHHDIRSDAPWARRFWRLLHLCCCHRGAVAVAARPARPWRVEAGAAVVPAVLAAGVVVGVVLVRVALAMFLVQISDQIFDNRGGHRVQASCGLIIHDDLQQDPGQLARSGRHSKAHTSAASAQQHPRLGCWGMANTAAWSGQPSWTEARKSCRSSPHCHASIQTRGARAAR